MGKESNGWVGAPVLLDPRHVTVVSIMPSRSGRLEGVAIANDAAAGVRVWGLRIGERQRLPAPLFRGVNWIPLAEHVTQGVLMSLDVENMTDSIIAFEAALIYGKDDDGQAKK